MEGAVIDGKYRIERKFGIGSHGVVYVGTDLDTKENVAMKMERVDATHGHLYHEGFQYDNMFDWNTLHQQTAQSSTAVPRLPLSEIDMVPGVIDGHGAPETVKPAWDGGTTSVSYARNRQ